MSQVAIAAQKKIRARRSTLIFPYLTQAAPKRSLSMPDVSRLNFQVIQNSKADMILPSCDLESGSQETLSSGYCSQGKPIFENYENKKAAYGFLSKLIRLKSYNFYPESSQIIQKLKALPAAKDQSPATLPSSQICLKS